MWGRRLARASRADVLWSVAAFALLQLGLAVAIEGWLPQMRDPYFAYRAVRLVRRTTAARQRPLTVLMLGSSRVFYGLKAQELEARLSHELSRPVVVFNFGTLGGGPVVNGLHFHRLYSHGVRPDLLLVEVGPSMLSGRDPRPAEAENIRVDRLWLRELRRLKRYNFPAAEMRREWWESWPVPTYSHRFAILSLLDPNLLPAGLRLDAAPHVDDWGWQHPAVTTVSPEHRREWLEINLREQVPRLQSYRLGGPACLALHDLLAFARSNGIGTGVVWMPEPSELRACYSPQAVAQVRAFMARLGREFSAQVTEAREWIADEYFMDGLHLLAGGADLFTERYGREVIRPLLLNAPADTARVPLVAGSTPTPAGGAVRLPSNG
jgi:hypothetical protein